MDVNFCICACFCVCEQRPCNELITRPRSPTDCLRSRKNRSETEGFMEVGQGPNWGCSVNEKTKYSLYSHSHCTTHLTPFCNTYIVSRRTHRKHIRFAAMETYEPQMKHIFLYCCIYSALHRNGSYLIAACVFIAAGMYLRSRCLEISLQVTILIKCTR
jgi:hypothetical protein